MSGQWEQYVEAAAKAQEQFWAALRGHTDHPDEIDYALARATLAVVGPLIAEDTRVRMVEAAGRAVERAGREDEDQLRSCIWIDPGRQVGVACFGGTRVPVDPFMAIVEEAGVDAARALWPSVTEEHVAAGKLWRARYHEWGRGVR